MVLTIIFLFAVLIQPTLIKTQEYDCEEECEENCGDNCESACGCIGCPPISLAVENLIPDLNHSLTVSSYRFADQYDGSKCEFVNRLDRPPQILL